MSTLKKKAGSKSASILSPKLHREGDQIATDPGLGGTRRQHRHRGSVSFACGILREHLLQKIVPLHEKLEPVITSFTIGNKKVVVFVP